MASKCTVDLRSDDDAASLLLRVHNQKTLQHVEPITSGMNTLNQLKTVPTLPANKQVKKSSLSISVLLGHDVS